MVGGGGLEPPAFVFCDLTRLSERRTAPSSPRDTRHPVSTPFPDHSRGLVRYCPIARETQVPPTLTSDLPEHCCAGGPVCKARSGIANGPVCHGTPLIFRPPRRLHRMRQRDYRLRRAEARVTDHGSPVIVSPVRTQRNRLRICAVCGRYSRWIDPFPAIPLPRCPRGRQHAASKRSKIYVFR
jgi:hypothetical protein